MDLDEQYPLPPPLPGKPLAKDVGQGKRFATRADYLAAKEAWQREDDSPDRRAMRLARSNARKRAQKRKENSAPNPSNARRQRTQHGGLQHTASDTMRNNSGDTDCDGEAEASEGRQQQQQRQQQYASGTAGLPVGARHSIDRMPRLAALKPIPDACRSVGRSVAGGRMGFPDKPSATDLRTFRELVRSNTVLPSSRTASRAKPVC